MSVNRIQRFFRRALAAVQTRPSLGQGQGELETEVAATRRSMTGTLVFGLEARDVKLGVIEHCARVSLLAGMIAERIGLSEADAYILQTAAKLHEIGMFAIPPRLVESPAPLSPPEREQVRSQAAMSAAVARVMHHPRVALLIEHQYDDYLQLNDREQIGSSDRLLAGILRIADVITAVTWPRPYQDPMPIEYRAELLQSGAGTKFHPLVVPYALKL